MDTCRNCGVEDAAHIPSDLQWAVNKIVQLETRLRVVEASAEVANFIWKKPQEPKCVCGHPSHSHNDAHACSWCGCQSYEVEPQTQEAG